MDLEAMARAAFERLHELNNRRREWETHPEGDNGAEYGRDAFREMVAAAMRVVGLIPAVANDDTPPAVEGVTVPAKGRCASPSPPDAA